MIFRVTMKDPDTLYDAINEAVENGLDNFKFEEAETLKDVRFEEAQEVANKWFDYGEYLTVEIDTDKETIRVVPVGEE